MENHTAIAKVDEGKVTVWASTQAPFRVKDQVAEALGFLLRMSVSSLHLWAEDLAVKPDANRA